MKKTILSLSILLILATFAFGQTSDKGSLKGKSTEQKIMQIEETILTSILQGKFDAVEKYYADGFVFSSPDGMLIPKNDIISAFKSGALKVESSTNSNMKVTVYGNTAIARYKSTDQGSFNGQTISGTYQWTDVFVKIKGNWALISTHGTPIIGQ